MAEQQFHIHNTSKSVHTRMQRVAVPGNPKTSLMLAGGAVRVLRGRPYPVTLARLTQLIPELLGHYDRGFARVTDPTGREVDPRTLKALPVKKKVKEVVKAKKVETPVGKDPVTTTTPPPPPTMPDSPGAFKAHLDEGGPETAGDDSTVDPVSDETPPEGGVEEATDAQGLDPVEGPEETTTVTEASPEETVEGEEAASGEEGSAEEGSAEEEETVEEMAPTEETTVVENVVPAPVQPQQPQQGRKKKRR
jgi:hypothetical protein